MKFLLFHLLAFTFISLNSIGQITSRELDGEWLLINNNDNYIKGDTLKLYRGLDYKDDKNICKVVIWKKRGRKLNIKYIGNCVDTSSILNYNQIGKIKLTKSENTQHIDITFARKDHVSFKILNYKSETSSFNENYLSVLTLVRSQNSDSEQIKSNEQKLGAPSVWYYWYIFQFL